MVPARGVHGDAAERVDPVDVGQLRHGEHAAGVDHESGGDLLRPGRCRAARGRARRRTSRQDLGVEPDSARMPYLSAQCSAYAFSSLPGAYVRDQSGALLERELVGERRDVHGDPGIGVPVTRCRRRRRRPRPSVVVQSRLVELDRGADPGEPGADDDGVVVRGVGHGRLRPITVTPCLRRSVSVASSSTRGPGASGSKVNADS